ncbi:hypothetical protein MBLNU230_g3435t1 [Neophaeotheca triangularis]
MPFNTLTVATAVTPSVIETYISHYLNRAPLRQKPTAHISYHEGLRLIRQFLDYSSKHRVEDLQAFTAQWVPAPTWVRAVDMAVPEQFLDRAAELLVKQLGPRGVDKIGGKKWWRWRRSELKAEWIEMKKDYAERKRTGGEGDRVMLYIHGGAYYFGSVDEHRYQMQRHARKLKARVLAPRYRLAPQFPFPCGLYDCIATYLYLLEDFAPEQILVGGDSAGGGMTLSMLVTLRDQGIPLPAGTILLSPWVDLTHSFPSVAGDGDGDYIPPHGFLHKPSPAWPPPNSDEMKAIAKSAVQDLVDKEAKAVRKSMADDGGRRGSAEKTHDQKMGMEEQEAIQGFTVDEDPNIKKQENPNNPATSGRRDTAAGSTIPGPGHDLSIMIDGDMIQIKDQIQLYTTNQLLAHPLVSPVTQPSLGGLPPMLIQVGGSELLRDEQLYLAHKAANPKVYPSSDWILDEYDPHRHIANKYPPTDVQLQLWDDLCHVPHTLSFTRPAKYMYRSVAQFGAWALAHAQHKAITIPDDDSLSIISSGTDSNNSDAPDKSSDSLPKSKKPNPDSTSTSKQQQQQSPTSSVGKAGDPLPSFKRHMIRQRITRHGIIYPLVPPSELEALNLDAATIGIIKPGPVRKWLAAKKANDMKFATEKRKIQKKMTQEIASGPGSRGTENDELLIGDEVPPPTALAGRKDRMGVAGGGRAGVNKGKKSWGLAMWSGWGSNHDQDTIEREEKAIAGRRDSASRSSRRKSSQRPEATEPETAALRETSVADKGQLEGSNTSLPAAASATDGSQDFPAAPTVAAMRRTSSKVEGSESTYLSQESSRPHNGTVAYPFKLRSPGLAENESGNTSTLTLDSHLALSLAPEEGESGGGVGESGLDDGVGVAWKEGQILDSHAEDVAARAVGAPVAAAVGDRTELERPCLETFTTAREPEDIPKARE